MAVNTGIRFTNTFVRATPISRTTPANSTKAMTDAKTANIRSEVTASVVILISEMVERSVTKKVGIK
jgi:hypothetical protein